ncbi:MAG: TolC family protein [Polyangiales bacterium]
MLGLIAAAPALAEAPPPVQGLSVQTVLRAVDAHHPKIAAVLQKIEAARGKRLKAQGGFDPELRLKGEWKPEGFYQTRALDSILAQPTPLWGAEIFAGWRIGRGNFAVYDGGFETQPGGEVRAGIAVPVWRDGWIDRRRTDVRQTRIGARVAELEARSQRIELYRQARRAYLSWLGAGLDLQIQQALLTIATERQRQIEVAVQEGALPPLDAIDNRRLMLRRRDRVLRADQRFLATAVALSLYYRDGRGQPVRPGRQRLPAALPEVRLPAARLPVWLKRAQRERPELLALAQRRDIADLELDLAGNQQAPDVRLQAYVAKDLGAESSSLEPAELGLGVEAKWPLPLRRSRGDKAVARADKAQLVAQLRGLRDQIGAQVRQAWLALHTALRRFRVSDEGLRLSVRVSAAERARFREGTGTLVVVNLRETAEAETASERLSALADFHRAYADLLAAVGALR